MIQEFVEKWETNKADIEAKFRQEHPTSYKEIVRTVVQSLEDSEKYSSISAERIHEINDGDYQGTLLFIIAASGYQPSTYWYVKVSYGSCSGCDTLESIREYSSEPPTEAQVKDYMTLALHIVQGLKEME